MNHSTYPSDLKEEQSWLIEPRPPPEKDGRRPNEVDHREVSNGIFYLVKTGIPWWYMPHDLPLWDMVHFFYRQWRLLQDLLTAPNGLASRQMAQEKFPSQGVNHATIEKRREKVLVVKILTQVVFGTMVAPLATSGQSSVIRWIKTSDLERQNATDRHRNAGKTRTSYTFSNDCRAHESMMQAWAYDCDFCWPVRTLAEWDVGGCPRRRTLAMAEGLADHAWAMGEPITMPCVQRR